MSKSKFDAVLGRVREEDTITDQIIGGGSTSQSVGNVTAQTYTEFIYNSTGIQSANRYNTWADLEAELQSTEGYKRVTFENTSVVLPPFFNEAITLSGSYDNVTFRGNGTGSIQAEVSTEKLELSFDRLIDKVNKATDDIYARYDYSDTAVEPDGTYIGYVAQSGDWFIQKIVGADQASSSRFAVGKKGSYRDSWGKKRSLKYKLRSEVYIP